MKFLVVLPYRENDPGWDLEIKDDVIEECRKHGGIVHIYVDKNSSEVSDYLYTVTFATTFNAVLKPVKFYI